MDPLEAPAHDSPAAQHAVMQQVRHTSDTGAGLKRAVSEVSFMSNRAVERQGSLSSASSERMRVVSDCVCQPLLDERSWLRSQARAR